MSDHRYSVGVFDRAGEYLTSHRPTLAQAKSLRAIYKARWPDKTVQIFDAEQDGKAIDPDEEDDDA